MYGSDGEFWGFLDKYVLAPWLNDSISGEESVIYNIVHWCWSIMFLLLGARLAYIIFFKKESSRYVNTETIYLVYLVVNILFASMLKLIPFFLICGLLFILLLSVIKSGYAEITEDERRGIYAYLPWIRRDQERSNALENDLNCDAKRRLHIVAQNHFHYEPRMCPLIILSWVPAMLVFIVLNYMVPR